MTDSTNTTKEEPKKAGKSFFFDFVNKGLEELNNSVEANDTDRRNAHVLADSDMLNNLGIDSKQIAKMGQNPANKVLKKDKYGNVLSAKEAVETLIRDSKGNIGSIITKRLEIARANRENRSIDRKIRRLDRQEARKIRQSARYLLLKHLREINVRLKRNLINNEKHLEVNVKL